MINTRDFLTKRDWIKRTAEETADFIAKHFGDERDFMNVVVGHMCATAAFEEKPDDLLFWSCVFARVSRRSLNETARRELALLLNDAKRWGH
mgnify:CR=1 FL=1